ncbi:sugar ABC transporter substrate-binding protein [Chloroflexi bacterium TSY]|nr:sugar ABC transporter substrate-binding protein [Chloroflexi bacterium TSY]
MRSSTLSRRSFLQLSSFATAGAILAACQPAAAPSGGDAAPGAEVIEIVMGTTENSDDNSEIYTPLAETFKESNSNVNISFLGIVSEGGWGGYFDKLAVILAGGETVDIAKIPTEGGRLAAARGLTIPIDDYIANSSVMDDYFEDVSEELAKTFVYGGKTYALPYAYEAMFIWFNTKRLEEEGLDIPPEDWTFSDFREYASALTKRDGDQTTHYGFSFWTSPFGLCPWLFNNGLDGMMEGDHLEIPKMTDPAYIEVVQHLYDMMYVDQSVPRAGSSVATSFESGTVAMAMQGRWRLSSYLAEDFTDFAIQYWPMQTRHATEVGCGAWHIFKASQHPDIAWEWEQSMLSKESIEYLSVDNGVNVAARRSVGYSDAFTEWPVDQGRLFYESIDREFPVIPVTSPADFSEMEQISNRWLSQVFADELGVEEALESCQNEMQQMVDRRPPEWAELG